jgi:transcriptional regulator with XRE-family HTH domain
MIAKSKHMPIASNINLVAHEIGRRLKAFRLGTGLSADELADKIEVSRAALYRYEKGEPPKLELLDRIATVLGVSLTTLLGVGAEYIPSALSFFERMRQIEAESEQCIAMFAPLPFLLTTEKFDKILPELLKESVPDSLPDRDSALKSANDIATLLLRRKEQLHVRRPNLVMLVSAAEVQRLLLQGFVGRHALPEKLVNERRELARIEVQRIIDIIDVQPIGVQIGVLVDSAPTTSFQIFRQREQELLAISPFRIGDFPNVRVGVAIITSDPDAVGLHSDVAQELWQRSLKAGNGRDHLHKILQDTPI